MTGFVLSMAIAAMPPAYLDKPPSHEQAATVEPWVAALAFWSSLTVLCLVFREELR